MNISELIEKLSALQAEHGDVRVLSTSGCGCCEWNEPPSPQFSEDFEHSVRGEWGDQDPEPTVLLNA